MRLVGLAEFTDLVELSKLLSRKQIRAAALDAHLTLPPEGDKWRPAERELMAMKIVSYSPAMRAMRSLHSWAKKVHRNLKQKRVLVCEVYPHATFSILFRARNPMRGDLAPKKTLRGLRQRVEILGAHIKGFSLDEVLKHNLNSEIYDALDATAAALTAGMVISGRAVAAGDQIWIPNPAGP